MELQLGLAPPTHNLMKGFDLNYHEFEPKSIMGFELWSHHRPCLDSEKYMKNKRSFDEAFETIDEDTKPTLLLPLLSWNEEPADDDGDRKEQKKRGSYNINKDDGDEDHVVGWPPIKSSRKKLLFCHQVGRIRHNRTAAKEGGVSNYMYVKVRMEGVSIGRKVDLKNYQSYETLLHALIGLFATYQEGNKDGTNYTLTYQDKEGDWLLAGDVPWKTFISTVQRLEILRNNTGESATRDADNDCT